MLTRGRYRARFAETAEDLRAAQTLRHLCFRGGEGLDADRFDALCHHVLVEDTLSGRLSCCFRLMPLAGGAEIGDSYSAQFYGLDALRSFEGPMVEMGRFCIHPEARDADVLRVAWGAMTRFVDDNGVELLFGCSSFRGTEASSYLEVFDMLAARHLAPKRWLPRVKAKDVFRFAERLRRNPKPDRKAALDRMPPLLKTYLLMGGWVSDHAVVDRDMNTLHVFTGLEIASVPPARARALRAIAG
ncbi:GNAT family N-acetyltransferase [Pelagovum pacificum]|uniref:L-ornithine N(alpha)-acyltransferase n=1 Tax=Pelagovum pacificum TaxID=2588711 RepID=A0A5C5GER0_9RHOB|nr:GNAT family N-acetyltransferase [Pelagovum pacificum]QQA44356.1 GNAT family N-acetyltransferase [Pelagovum pacificum]TNY32527.1 GNAT family N-acetyltransferase [Pelagovum pacificum]